MDDVKRKVYLDLFATPGTLLPVAGGLTAWIASWALGGDATLNFAGLAGVLTGIGIMSTRLILGLEQITQRAYDHVLTRQQQEREERLEQLHQRLLPDGDPRDETCLQELRHLYTRVKERSQAETMNAAAFSVLDGVDQMFDACVRQLEHSAELWETARSMKGPARANLLQQREQMIHEVCETVVHLGRTVERYHELTSHKNRSELARLRKELDQSLQLARAVEQRTEQLIAPPLSDPQEPS